MVGLALALLLSADPPTTTTLEFQGRFFQKGSNKKTLLFTSEGTITREGNVRREHDVFHDARGAVALIEDATFVDGKLQSYQLDQRQLDAKGSIEVKDGKARYAWTQNGKTRTGDEDSDANLLPGPGFFEFIKEHWAELTRGDTIKVRFAVIDRRESFGFKLYKDRELKVGGKDCVAITLKATNPFVALVVDPATFIMTKDGLTLVEVDGRTTPKLKVGDAFKDCDAEALFTGTQR